MSSAPTPLRFDFHKIHEHINMFNDNYSPTYIPDPYVGEFLKKSGFHRVPDLNDVMEFLFYFFGEDRQEDTYLLSCEIANIIRRMNRK